MMIRVLACRDVGMLDGLIPEARKCGCGFKFDSKRGGGGLEFLQQHNLRLDIDRFGKIAETT
jgi:hypothetical protein